MSSFPDGAGQSHAWNYVLYLLRSIERLADITSYCHPVRLLSDGLECKDSDLLLLAQGHELWSTSFGDARSPSWPRDEIVPYIHDVLHWTAATVICNRRLFTCRRQAVARTVKKGMGATALALRLHDRFPAARAAEWPVWQKESLLILFCGEPFCRRGSEVTATWFLGCKSTYL